MIAWETYRDNVLQLLGCRWLHAGRDPGIGLDCVGVPYAAAVACGLELEPTIHYGVQPTQEQLSTGLQQFCDPCTEHDRAHIWQVPFVGGARHVVVPVEQRPNGMLCVAAWSRRGRVIEIIWRRQAVQAWTIRGIEWQAQA